MTNSRFTYQHRLAIKRRIWDGELHKTIAYTEGMSIHSIRSVVAGMLWADVLWPDGSTDELSHERRDEILKIRYEESGGRVRTYGARAYGQIQHGHLSRRADPRSIEEEKDKELAIHLLPDDATADQIQEKAAELKKRRLEYEQEIQAKRDEEDRVRRAKADEEQATYEKWLAEHPEEPETKAERENKLVAKLFIKDVLQKDVADQLRREKLLQILEANMDQPAFFKQLSEYLGGLSENDHRPEEKI